MTDNKKNIKSLDEIVFENKNKNYGAYRLRSNEKGYLLYAFIIGTIIFSIIVLALYFYTGMRVNKKEKENTVIAKLQNEIKAKKEEKKEKKKEEKKEKKKEEKKIYVQKEEAKQEKIVQVKTIKYIEPKVDKKVKVQETQKDINDLIERTKKIDNVDNKKGEDASRVLGGNKGAREQEGVPKGEGSKLGKEIDTSIHRAVDEEAEYPGGMNSLRNSVFQNVTYPPEAEDKGKEGRVVIEFVVERDGNITGFRVVKDGVGYGAGQEVIRALKRTKKWKPAKKNGGEVRSYYNFVVDFTLPSG